MGFTFTVQEAPDTNLPEGSEHTARLDDLQKRTINWKKDGEDKSADVLEWWWEITDSDNENAIGRRIKGSCNAEITKSSGNRFYRWAEALLQREIPIGYNVDSDDLVGLSAKVVIGHRPDRRDPNRIWQEVAEVRRLDGSDDPWGGSPWGASASDNPPF